MPWLVSQIVSIFNILFFLFLNLHAKICFLACVYPGRYGHGKSGNRARKHYKKNWAFWQRIFWVFIFKEEYSARCRALAWFFYIHAVITLFMPFLSPHMMQALEEDVKWYAWNKLALILLFLFWLVRQEYTSWINRSHWKSRRNKRKR